MSKATKYPLVSIGIPTYNRSGGLCRTLMSLWAQEYPNLEIIISDNNSTDDTEEFIDVVSRIHPEIKYYRQPSNIGMIKNFEFVLREARGKYFMWVADDDILENGVLRKYVRFLEEHSDYVLVSGAIKYWLNPLKKIVLVVYDYRQPF